MRRNTGRHTRPWAAGACCTSCTRTARARSLSTLLTKAGAAIGRWNKSECPGWGEATVLDGQPARSVFDRIMRARNSCESGPLGASICSGNFQFFFFFLDNLLKILSLLLSLRVYSYCPYCVCKVSPPSCHSFTATSAA